MYSSKLTKTCQNARIGLSIVEAWKMHWLQRLPWSAVICRRLLQDQFALFLYMGPVALELFLEFVIIVVNTMFR